MIFTHSLFRFEVTLLLFAVLGLGCAKPQSKKATRVQEAVAQVVKPEEATSAWLKDSVLVALCGSQNLRAEKPKGSGLTPADQRVMCTSCPRVDSDLSPPGEAHVLAYVKGAFTRPHRSEALVSLSGCEAHYLNFGGTYLLEQSPESFLVAQRQPNSQLQSLRAKHAVHRLQVKGLYRPQCVTAEHLSFRR